MRGHMIAHSASKPTRVQVAAWCGVLAAILVLSLRDYDSFQLGTFVDDAIYITLARSLSTAHYGLISAPGDPALPSHPFGYPLLIAPWVWLFPDHADAPKLLSLVATLANAAILFWAWPWFSRSTSRWWALAVAALSSLAPQTIGHTRMVMSEPIFTTFSLAAIVLAERAVQGRHGRWWSTALSVVLVFVVFTRTIGLAVLAAIVVYLPVVGGRRAVRLLASVVIQMALIVAAIVSVTSIEVRHVPPSRYVGALQAHGIAPNSDRPLPQRLGQAASRLIGRDLRQAVLPLGGGERERAAAERLGLPMLPQLVAFLLSGLIGLGVARACAREGLSLFLLVPLIYLPVLLIWKAGGPRLLYPMQPALFLNLLLGIEAVMVELGLLLPRSEAVRRSARAVLPVAVAVLLLASVYGALHNDDSRLHAGDLQTRSSWLRARVDTADVIMMTEQPVVDALYSGVNTVPYPPTPTSPEELHAYLTRYNVTYILLAPELIWRPTYQPAWSVRAMTLLPLLETLVAERRIVLVFSSERDRVRVFRTLRPADSHGP